METAIKTLDLTRHFKRGKEKELVVALDHVSLKVEEGEIFGLLGPNGAGKTTLINILTTTLLPTTGTAYVKGMDVVEEASEIRRIISLVSGGESPGYGILTARENLWFFSQLYGVPGKVANERIKELMEKLEFTDYANTKMHKLSTGYKQRLNLARGFISDPDVLFLDEPTLGLDILSAKRIRSLVKEWVKGNSEKTLLLTTHYMAEAEEMCNRVAMIDHGKILACDTPENLKNDLKAKATLRLEVPSDEGGYSWLREMPGVLGFSETAHIETGTTTLKLLLEDELEIIAISDRIKRKRLKVISMSETRPTLEDVYISLVGRGLK
ncbi:MAG: ABC transporter ATP-binding protein [Candidatus Geothermarchaeales archaeon]